MDTNLHSCLLVGFAGWAFILDMGGLSAEDLLRRKKALIHRKRELEEYKVKNVLEYFGLM